MERKDFDLGRVNDLYSRVKAAKLESSKGIVDELSLEADKNREIEALKSGYITELRQKLCEESHPDFIRDRSCLDKAWELGISEKELDEKLPELRRAYDDLLRVYSQIMKLPYVTRTKGLPLEELRQMAFLFGIKAYLLGGQMSLPTIRLQAGELFTSQLNKGLDGIVLPEEERAIKQVAYKINEGAVARMLNRDEMEITPDIKLCITYDDGRVFEV